MAWASFHAMGLKLKKMLVATPTGSGVTIFQCVVQARKHGSPGVGEWGNRSFHGNRKERIMGEITGIWGHGEWYGNPVQ